MSLLGTGHNLCDFAGCISCDRFGSLAAKTSVMRKLVFQFAALHDFSRNLSSPCFLRMVRVRGQFIKVFMQTF